MRITGNRVLDLASQATSRAQADVADRSNQLTSGLRVNKPSDDPLAWAQARRAAVHHATSTGRGEGLALGRGQLVDTERALTTLGDVFAEGKTLAIQAASAGYSADDRAALGSQVEAMYATALAAANTRTSAGEYVLAGGASTTQPFDAAGNYGGDADTRSLELDERGAARSTIAGSSLTSAEGIDVLPTLARLRTALAANDLTGITTAIGELDTAHQQITRTREHLGGILSAIDDADGARGALEETLTSRITDLVEVDLVSGANQLARSANALTAAQAVSAKLASLLAPR